MSPVTTRKLAAGLRMLGAISGIAEIDGPHLIGRAATHAAHLAGASSQERTASHWRWRWHRPGELIDVPI